MTSDTRHQLVSLWSVSSNLRFPPGEKHGLTFSFTVCNVYTPSLPWIEFSPL